MDLRSTEKFRIDEKLRKMITLPTAKEILLKNISSLPGERLPLSESYDRVILEDVFSPIAVPSFDNSAMDGYAIIFSENKRKYKIAGEMQAGDSLSGKFDKEDAVRIFTGTLIPIGLDTVIKQEDVIVVEGGFMYYDPQKSFKGSNVRKIGEQCSRGDLLARKGDVITPGVVALLASVGIKEIEVVRVPKVKVLVTGNELVEPGSPLRPGSIYNSNQSSIVSYLKFIGIKKIGAEVVRDDYVHLTSKVGESLEDYDMLIISGGISVGKYDYTYEALTGSGVKSLFYGLRQKPGKPLFAGKKDEKLIFALPGNPAAVMSCMNQFVKPSLFTLMGRQNAFRPSGLLPLAHKWKKESPYTNILKARSSGDSVTILEGQESFNLRSFSEANAFVVLYEEARSMNVGDLVEIYNW